MDVHLAFRVVRIDSPTCIEYSMPTLKLKLAYLVYTQDSDLQPLAYKRIILM